MINDTGILADIRSLFSRMKIRTKLISIISLIVITSLTGMILLATYFFKSDNEIRANELNLKIAEITSMKIQTDFESIVEKLNLMGNTMIQQFPQKALFTDLFFTNDRNMIYVGIGRRMGNTVRYDNYIYNRAYFAENRLTNDNIELINSMYESAFLGAFNNEALVHNVSKSFGVPVLGITLPFQKNIDGSVATIIVGYLKLDKFLQAFQKRDIFETFMVTSKGDIIAHQDSRIVLSHGNYLNLPIVEEMLKSKLDNGQKRYRDAEGVYRLGSFKKIGFGGLGIIATVSEDEAFKAVYQIQRRNILIMIIVLNLAILVVYFFSKTISKPIVRLLGATKEIEKGNFRVDIVPTSGDEIGELTTSFVAMGKGLEEREKLKETFGKFVNKEIAEMVLKGEVKLGGERKSATVFFSDIRQFTAISERLEPEEVVEFLNQYMTRMVNCVNVTNGVVDKFIGDAIMAVWGAPVSYGNDTENAVNGALMMRNELMGFNRGRGGDKKPTIRIGCGINTGPVLAGQIGSEERMEYTVIGDTVNLASRIEALNKPFGTDILISTDTYNIVKDVYLVEPMQKIKVKGKSEPQQIYAVLGRKDDPAAPRDLDQLRKMLGIEMTGKPEVPAGEEVKYEIIED
ncbi:MAG: HAMP domain-containing protein [Spirochaetes bacterium]|nr:HAMP domain-containing protein [Spirochaetota bacterium]